MIDSPSNSLDSPGPSDGSLGDGFSVCLDALRFMTAIAVVLYHARYLEFGGQVFGVGYRYGWDAVKVFFVLSGFVIAYVAETKSNSLPLFFRDRLSRLYSVVVPAILVTCIADSLGHLLAPEMYTEKFFSGEWPIARLAANLTFANQLWFANIRPLSNAPFWSLGYEFWFYAIFACTTFLSGWNRIATTLIVAVIAGPKILLLFPVWWMGVWSFRTGRTMQRKTGLLLLIWTITFGWVYYQVGLPKYIQACTEVLLGQS
ncbi:MAG: acyltransferase, partial [Planctomycetota bacterium]